MTLGGYASSKTPGGSSKASISIILYFSFFLCPVLLHSFLRDFVSKNISKINLLLTIIQLRDCCQKNSPYDTKSDYHSSDQNPSIILPFYIKAMSSQGFPVGINGKELACQCRRYKNHRFNPCLGKIPWRRAWQPIPVFLPGESPG